jgi:hypothetical protein
VGVVISLLFPLVGWSAGTMFPSKQSCVSPNLKWIVRCQSEEQKDGGGLHRLFLSRLGFKDETFVYASGRHCDVLWSDGGERFAITDWLGSNVSDIYVVEVSPTIVWRFEIPDVAKVLLKTELEGHIYWEAMKWEKPNRLLVRIFGHTDEEHGHGFTYYFSVDINSREAVLVRKTNEEGTDWESK